MEHTNEYLEKVKAAKSAEELIELAKADNVELTAKEAEKMYAELHKSGELSDEELEKISGGTECYRDGVYYEFMGTNKEYETLAYRCPNCNKVIYEGSWWLWRCDTCKEKWWFTDNLKPNFESGLWRALSAAEIKRRRGDSTRVKG